MRRIFRTFRTQREMQAISQRASLQLCAKRPAFLTVKQPDESGSNSRVDLPLL